MIKAIIKTQTRILEVPCRDNKEQAISSLHNAVSRLNKEDGRCRFIVLNNGAEIYSWSYQPTIRNEKKGVKVSKDPKYGWGCIVYILLNGKDLCYENFYHDAEFFSSVKDARVFMKERGFSAFDYRVVYEYSVDGPNGTLIGAGLGFTKLEAKESLNKSLAYYNLELRNGRVIEV